jgi:hypothetical protein
VRKIDQFEEHVLSKRLVSFNPPHLPTDPGGVGFSPLIASKQKKS